MPNEIEVAKSAAASSAAIELRLPDVGRVLRNFVSNREVGEFLSGALAGAMTKAVLAPLETIRTRMIVGVGSKHITGSFLEIIEENGWQGLWAGNTINMVRIVPTQAIEFGTFECVKRMVSSAQEKWKDAESPKLHVGHMKMDLFFSWLSPVAVGGAAAGIVSTLVCHPLEVIKDRLTVNREIYPTISLAFRKIYKDDGVGGLYAGIFPTLVGMLPYSTCYYFMYETVKSSYCQSKKKKNLNRAELLVIGAVSEIELDSCEERLLENAKKYIFKHTEVHKKVAQESSRRKAEEHHHCPHYGSRQVAATTAKENNSIQHNHKNGWQRGTGGQHHKGTTNGTIASTTPTNSGV